MLLIIVTDGLPTFSRVYTRIDVFLCYYSLLNIFNKEMRGYYSLEKLWENGENIEKIDD